MTLEVTQTPKAKGEKPRVVIHKKVKLFMKIKVNLNLIPIKTPEKPHNHSTSRPSRTQPNQQLQKHIPARPAQSLLKISEGGLSPKRRQFHLWSSLLTRPICLRRHVDLGGNRSFLGSSLFLLRVSVSLKVNPETSFRSS